MPSAIPATQAALADLLAADLPGEVTITRGVPPQLPDAERNVFLVGTENIIRLDRGIGISKLTFDLRLVIEAHMDRDAGDYDQVCDRMWQIADQIEDAVEANSRFGPHVTDSTFAGREENSGFVRDHWISRLRAVVSVTAEPT